MWTVQCENAGVAATGAFSGLPVSMMWMMRQQERFSGLPCGLSSVNHAGEGSTVQCENAATGAFSGLTVSMMWMMQQQDRFSGLPCGLSSVNDARENSTIQYTNTNIATTGALNDLTMSMMWVMQQQDPSVACHVHCPL